MSITSIALILAVLLHNLKVLPRLRSLPESCPNKRTRSRAEEKLQDELNRKQMLLPNCTSLVLFKRHRVQSQKKKTHILYTSSIAFEISANFCFFASALEAGSFSSTCGEICCSMTFKGLTSFAPVGAGDKSIVDTTSQASETHSAFREGRSSKSEGSIVENSGHSLTLKNC